MNYIVALRSNLKVSTKIGVLSLLLTLLERLFFNSWYSLGWNPFS